MTPSRWISIISVLVVTVSAPLPGSAPTRARQALVTVSADFAVPVDYPLIKSKFGVFNSCLVPLWRYRRDMHFFSEVRPDSLRIDGGLGKAFCAWTNQFVTGTAATSRYDFTDVDQLINLLEAHTVVPYWSYDYMPDALQPVTGDYKSPPSSYAAWQRVLRAFAAHFRATGRRVGYQEIYNEPDNKDFWSGTEDDYMKLYDYGARGVRQGDPDAVVGGPALAFTNGWVSTFLNHVSTRKLPLDFFSFHFYGTTSYDNETMAQELETLREDFAHRPYFDTTEWDLNEYNSYSIDYPPDGAQQHDGLAEALLNDYAYFLTQPELTEVSWAQFLDSGAGNFSGMVSIDGHRKAVFNADKIYAMMPVDRRQVTIRGARSTLTGTTIQGMASTDSHKADLVLWNGTGSAQTLSVRLAHIPFARGTLRVYRIDADHASWGDNPTHELLIPTETRARVNTASLLWSGAIPTGGVVYLDVDDGSGISALTPAPVARVVRTLHYYPDRSSPAYADFDRNTWIARLGMATAREADEEVGVTADALPRTLSVTTTVDGLLRKLDANSVLGVRVDYMVGGAYTSSVLFHGPYNGVDLYDPARGAAMPWGSGRRPDHVARVPNLAHFRVGIAALAPPHWGGRAQITFILQDAGRGARATMVVRAG